MSPARVLIRNRYADPPTTMRNARLEPGRSVRSRISSNAANPNASFRPRGAASTFSGGINKLLHLRRRTKTASTAQRVLARHASLDGHAVLKTHDSSGDDLSCFDAIANPEATQSCKWSVVYSHAVIAGIYKPIPLSLGSRLSIRLSAIRHLADLLTSTREG